MAAKLASDQLVFSAADVLTAEGQAPTTTLVRERIGVGSFTTIQAALGRWSARVAEERACPVPEEVSSQINAFAKAVWIAAHDQSRATEAQAREHARQQLAAASAALDEVTKEVRRLEQLLEVAAEERIRLQDSARNACETAAAHLARTEYLQAALEAATARFTDVQAERDAHCTAAAASQAQLDLLQQQNDRLLAMLNQAQPSPGGGQVTPAVVKARDNRSSHA